MSKSKVDIPLYFGHLIIVFTNDVKATSDRYDLGLDGKHYPAFVMGKRDRDGITEYYMVFDEKHISHSIIGHEVVHCANWIFYDREIKLDFLNDEPHAYLIGWITGRIYHFANKNKVKIRL